MNAIRFVIVLEDAMMSLFYPFIIGLLFGLTHFFLISPIKYDSNHLYLRHVVLNLFFIVLGVLLMYLLICNSSHQAPQMSSLQTNALFELITLFVCFI